MSGMDGFRVSFGISGFWMDFDVSEGYFDAKWWFRLAQEEDMLTRELELFEQKFDAIVEMEKQVDRYVSLKISAYYPF